MDDKKYDHIGNYTLLETNENSSRGDSSWYPGMRRNPLDGAPPANTMLMKTGGNALQAVPQPEEPVMAVTVPEGITAGTLIHVMAPDGRTIAATVPPDCFPGHTFFVQLPPKEEPKTYTADGLPVPSAPLQSDLDLEVQDGSKMV